MMFVRPWSFDCSEDERHIWAFRHPHLHAFAMRVRAWFARRAVCGYCDHFFDPADKRAHIPPADQRYSPSCPACTLMHLKGDPAWAVSNDCNGIFTVTFDRDEAIEQLKVYPGCEVIPVRVYEDVNREMREWEASR